MHLNKILDQIKHHPSPTEAIDKLGKALEKHEGSLLEKGFQILKSELCANVYEAINGPHFDEEHARYAVEGMENEDGTKGPHWTVEETTSVANQMGINLRSEKHNKWDWYVAMNMIYSDFYKAVVAMTGSNNTKHFAELTKAWICDKDISEGKMWHYYVYIMCDDEENDYKAYEHEYHKGNYSLNRYREPEYLDYDKYYHKHDRPYELRSRGYEYDDYSDMEMRRMKKDMTFSQLTPGTNIHVLEITGTFKKSTTYSLGKVVSVSKPYDEPLPPGQFPMPMQNRRKLVDLVISCDGEQKKLSVSEDKTMMTDSTIGLTIATDKVQIVDMVKQSYNDCKVKKESVLKYDEEMRRCEDILKLLNTTPDITTNVTKDFKELDELKAEVKELKQLLQNVTTVRPEVKIETPSSEEKQIEI